MNQWKLFVAAAVARYKPGGKFWTDHPGIAAHPPDVWQVYNEQNIPAFWPNGPSPNKYAGFLHGTADAIRASTRPRRSCSAGCTATTAMEGTSPTTS